MYKIIRHYENFANFTINKSNLPVSRSRCRIIAFKWLKILMKTRLFDNEIHRFRIKSETGPGADLCWSGKKTKVILFGSCFSYSVNTALTQETSARREKQKKGTKSLHSGEKWAKKARREKGYDALILSQVLDQVPGQRFNRVPFLWITSSQSPTPNASPPPSLAPPMYALPHQTPESVYMPLIR